MATLLGHRKVLRERFSHAVLGRHPQPRMHGSHRFPVVATFLHQQPPRPDDADNPLERSSWPL